MSAGVAVEGFGEKLKRMRKAQGLTQKDVANKLGFTTYQAYARYESRKYAPKEETLKRLSNAIGINLINEIIPAAEKRMSVGDTIECGTIDELIEMHDALCADGYGVDFDYERGKQAVLIITEVPEE